MAFGGVVFDLLGAVVAGGRRATVARDLLGGVLQVKLLLAFLALDHLVSEVAIRADVVFAVLFVCVLAAVVPFLDLEVIAVLVANCLVTIPDSLLSLVHPFDELVALGTSEPPDDGCIDCDPHIFLVI